ncbi:MAG: valine--tRNA ligase [Sedimentisphaerales bacterium]|nr:valine--tRNA ligase [Sedimentisphaerales bacterium]
MGEKLPKVYNPKAVEQQASEIWFCGGYFHAEPAGNGKAEKTYTIVIPPPNVTAPLHLGHALNNTLQDILIRFRRMQQYNTLWMPGTDHAGIATQTVVEKRILAEEGKRRTDLDRQDFVARVQAWKDEYEACIIGQLKAMGCSCDWERIRFTMDQVCAKAVRAAFFKLFEDGLIYRGKRLVNWDPATQTVLADDEVEHETVQGHFWYLRYPLVEPVQMPRGTAFQVVDHQVHKRNGAYLPHWTQTAAIYAVTFRLADSLPADVLERWRVERDKIVHPGETQGQELTSHQQRDLARLYCDSVEPYLNAGHGQCYLREPKVAELVANALKHFDGQRYDLIAWAVMPNHVHAILKPYQGIELPDILRSWKSYTANKANELLRRTGAFWQSEYYDHLIRDQEDFDHQVNYVLSNPNKAGLSDWPWVGAKIDNHGQNAPMRHENTAKMAVPLTIEYITVATTRPETMLGDTAVAMNPADPRAKFLTGKKVLLPIVGRIIPIIADEHVVLPNPSSDDEKAKFSTGFLKVTPAHDPDDWEIGQRHNLPVINVLAPDGSISDKHGWSDADAPEAQALLGMDRFEARQAIVEWFRTQDLLQDVRDYTHEVGHSYRSHVPIEPYLSDQWYIAVKKPIDYLAEKFGQGLIEGTDVPVNSLAGLALKPLLDGRLRFIPQRYGQTYQTWLENLRDWPISRQLWWGHQIPIWYCQKCGQFNSGLADPENCEKCGSADIVQDPDVLDTWFSSALWPFSTMGWPDETPELRTFYPGNVLCTAREIITLWVSRMVMMGQYCVGDIPFADVYIHAMIQDGEGRKMSKSLGNGIDPLVAINSHGADAMRFTLASMATDTQDIRMPVVSMTLPDGRQANTSPKFDAGRNFCNKLWNASRFALMNLEDIDPAKFDPDKMDITDRWILSRLARTIAEVTESLNQYKYSEPLAQLYRFFWNEFCDWYLEWIKPRMQDGRQKPIAQNVLAFVLDQTLRLLHPFLPFITEGIFQKLNEIAPTRQLQGVAQARHSTALVIAEWPASLNTLINQKVEEQIPIVQDAIRAIRDIRSKYNRPLDELFKVSAQASPKTVNILNENAQLITQLGGVKDFEAGAERAKPRNAATAIVGDLRIYVHDMIDPEAERQRLEKQKQQVETAKKAVEAKLSNKDFVSKAKPEVVAQAREKLAQLQEQAETIRKHLFELDG